MLSQQQYDLAVLSLCSTLYNFWSHVHISPNITENAESPEMCTLSTFPVYTKQITVFHSRLYLRGSLNWNTSITRKRQQAYSLKAATLWLTCIRNLLEAKWQNVNASHSVSSYLLRPSAHKCYSITQRK